MNKYNCGIYSIVSPSGNMYIGSSQNISKRWRAHKKALIDGVHHSNILQNAWHKYNGQFQFNKLLICRQEDLILYEQQFIDFYKPNYNISKTAGSPLGVVHTKEFKEKISKFQTGNKWMLGRKLSDETKEKVRLSLLGNQRAAKPHKNARSLEHCEKLSKIGLGHIVSMATRQKISDTFRFKREQKNVST